MSTNAEVHGCPSATSTCGRRRGDGGNAHDGRRSGAVVVGVHAGGQGLDRPGPRCRHGIGGAARRAARTSRRSEHRDRFGHAVVDEHGVHPLARGRRPRAWRRSPSSARTWASLGDSACRGLFSRMWTPGPEGLDGRDVAVDAGHVQRVERRPVPHEKPRRVVLRRSEPGHEFLDGRRCVTVLGERQRELAARPSGRERSVGGGAVGEARHHAVLVHRQPRPTGDLVAPAHDARAGVAQHRHGRGGALEPFVAVGADHERCTRVEARHHHEQAHRGQGSGGPATDTSSDRWLCSPSWPNCR